MVRSSRSKKNVVKCPRVTCRKECTDGYSGKDDTCKKCKLVVPEGERMFKCKTKKCKFKKCVYCVTGEARPVPESNDEVVEEEEEEEIITADPRGKAFEKVPKEKNNETDQETRARERLEITARQAQRVMDAKTNGVPGIMKKADFLSTTKVGTLAQCGQIPTAVLGGIMTPFLDEAGNGARMYEGADVNAGDPSGNRWKYRRYQRIFLKEGVIPETYKGNNHFVIQWIHVTERTGRKQDDQVQLWVSRWEHVTKGKCGVLNQAFLILPSDVESVQDYLCPFMPEHTHMVAHSRRGWSLAFAAWQKKQVWVIEDIQEDNEDVEPVDPPLPPPLLQ